MASGKERTNLQAIDSVHVDMYGDKELGFAERSGDDGSDL